jgi:deazaflavin-dependent oxidoreductase (nitroreductase family)
MLNALALTGAGLGLVVGGLAVVFLVGMRSNTPAVIDAVRRINRRVTNPRVMRSAGTPGASASVIRHTGRTTGRPRETPVGAIPTDDGFLIALPYGTRADWVRNVLAAGTATIVHGGETFPVGEPVVVPTAAVASELPPSERRMLRIFNVDRCLHTRHVAVTVAQAPAESVGGTL